MRILSEDGIAVSTAAVVVALVPEAADNVLPFRSGACCPDLSCVEPFPPLAAAGPVALLPPE